MKKIQIILLAAIAALLGACNNEEPLQQEQTTGESPLPQVIATIEQAPETRAGIIENADYTQGEKVYWMNGDKINITFSRFGGTFWDRKTYEYSAYVQGNTQSNSCSFWGEESSTSIPNAEWTVHAYYGNQAWNQMVSGTSTTIPVVQTQKEANSSHLSPYMPMKSISQKITINNGTLPTTPLNISFKQLTSIFRFAILNNTGNTNLQLTTINVKLASEKDIFRTWESLLNYDTDENSTELNPEGARHKSPSLTLHLEDQARMFSTQNGKDNLCQGYMSVLPIPNTEFSATDKLTFELTLTDGTNVYFVPLSYSIGTDLQFLANNGIQGGKSYYFRLKIENADLAAPISIDATPSYAIGDLWPDDVNPQGIVFWVQPGSFGKRGKVLAANQILADRWGNSRSDENAAGVAGIRSWTDGETATRNMIKHYSIGDLFDYGVFLQIYLVNGEKPDNIVWYLPALNELRMVSAGFNGKAYEEILPSWSFGSKMPYYGTDECKNARAAFNEKLVNMRGNALNLGTTDDDYYISSTEINDSDAGVFYFYLGETWQRPKAFASYMRWIRKFGY